MNRYIASLCWLLITLFSVVQFALPVTFNAPRATSTHAAMTIPSDADEMHTTTHCISPNDANNASLKHCTNVSCVVSCASHCMSVVPSAIVKISVAVVHDPFESMPAFKPKYSAIQPNTPPPKST